MKTLPPSVAQLQRQHVLWELECIDRMYLNAYVPKLTSAAGVAGFFRGYLGHRFASTKQAAAMTDAFVVAIRDFMQREALPLVRFQKGQRKDDVFQQYLRKFTAPEGVVFVGVAQEKARPARRASDSAPGALVPGQYSVCSSAIPGMEPLSSPGEPASYQIGNRQGRPKT